MSEIDTLRAEDVAEYLEQHPEFFAQHAQLLTQIQVPHPNGSGAIPLSQRQVLSLRDKNKALESKLGELIQFGEENDDISQRVHRLAVAMLGAASLDTLLTHVYDAVRADFAIPHVGVRLWRGSGEQEEFNETSAELQRFAAELPRPLGGANDNFEAVAWFGEAAPLVRSVVFIPLQENAQAFGLLALGSEDPARFYAQMGTLYLERIGELTSAALLRVL